LYAEKVNSNEKWSWQDVKGAENLTAKQRKQTKGVYAAS